MENWKDILEYIFNVSVVSTDTVWAADYVVVLGWVCIAVVLWIVRSSGFRFKWLFSHVVCLWISFGVLVTLHSRKWAFDVHMNVWGACDSGGRAIVFFFNWRCMMRVKLKNVQLNRVYPFIIPHFPECVSPLVHMKGHWVSEGCPVCFFLGVHRSDRESSASLLQPIYHNTGSEFSVGIHGMPEDECKPQLEKHSHQVNPWKNSWSISKALLFQQGGEKRANLCSSTTPCSAGKECALYKLNWGHAWHGNNRGRSHNFPESVKGGWGERAVFHIYLPNVRHVLTPTFGSIHGPAGSTGLIQPASILSTSYTWSWWWANLA